VGYTDYIGKRDVTIDAKHRVNIPAQFRKIMAEENVSEVVISRALDSKHLDIFPLPMWIKIRDRITDSMQLMNRTHRNVLRRLTQDAIHCKLDSQGRVMLTPDLMQLAGIEDGNTVRIIGVSSFMEMWNPDILKEHEENTPLTDDIYEKLEDVPLI